MSLKGYEFLNDDETKVIARFFFKDLSLFLYEKLSDEKLEEIKKYIIDNGSRIHKIVESEMI